MDDEQNVEEYDATEGVEDVLEDPESYRELLFYLAAGGKFPTAKIHLWRREEETIRSALYDAAAFGAAGLSPSHFDAPVHRLAWRTLNRILERKPDTHQVDYKAFISEMRSIEPQMMLGNRGVNWISGLLNENPMNFDDVMLLAVDDIKRHYQNRAWAATFAEINKRIETDHDYVDIQNEIHGFCGDIALEIEQYRMRMLSPSVAEFDWDENVQEKGYRVALGIESIDKLSAGGHGRGELMVVGGGTGHGKSYMLQRLLRNQGQLGNTALAVLCEDPYELCYCRMLSDFCDPPQSPSAIVQRKADPEIVREAKRKMAEEFGTRIFIEERKKPKLDDLCTLIRHYKNAKNIDMVFVDYLQAVTLGERNVSRLDEVSEVISKLKQTCTQYEVALVAFSQYSRNDYRDGTEPGLNACKYCGDIENEAEIMLMLWRDAQNNLYAKVPKVKWARGNQLKYEIDVDEVTGCFSTKWDPYDPDSEKDSKEGEKSSAKKGTRRG